MEVPQSEHAAYEVVVQKLKEELKKTKDENIKLHGELLSQELKLCPIQFTLNEKTKELEKIQNKIQMRQSFNNHLEHSISQKEIKLQTSMQEKQVLVSTVEQLTNMVHSVKSEKDILVNENKELKDEVAKYKKNQLQLITNSKFIQDSLSQIKINVKKFLEEKEYFHLNSSIPEHKIHSLANENRVLKEFLSKTINEKNLIQDECCYYKALSETQQKYNNNNVADEKVDYLQNQWRHDFDKSKEVIDKLVAHNVILTDLLNKAQSDDNAVKIDNMQD